MAQNYIRQSSFTDGDTITAGLFNNEYNQLVNAFAYSAIDVNATGHTHDGSLGQGGNISKIGDLDFLNKIEIDGTNNRMGFFVEVGGVTTEQVRISDGLIVPVTTNDIDLGSASLQFKDGYFDGTVNIDSLVADTADINGGTVDNVTIGGTTPAVATFTTANATTVDTTNIEVTNIKAKDGTAAGSIADSTGVVTLASSVLTTADINGGTLDAVTIGATTAAEITGTTITYGSLSDGTITITAFVDEDDMVSNSATLVPTQQSVKAYVDAQVTAQDLDIVGDTGTDAIDLDSETLTFTGGTGITSVVTAGTVTHNIDSTVATLTGTQTLTNKTIDADNNTVSNLEVDNLKTGVLDTDLASVSASHDTIPSAKAVYDYVAVLAGSSNPIFTGTVTADNVTINGNTILGSDAADTVTINADVASDLIPSVDGTYDLGASGAEWQDLFIDGTANIDSLVADTADINGGTIDNTVIGGTTPAAVTTSSLVATTADINAGTIDGTVIGGSTAAAGTFTTVTADGLTITTATPSIQMTDSDNNADAYIQGTDGNIRFYADDNNEAASSIITFNIDGGEKVRITDAGNVGIGAITVDQHLHVEGSGTQAIKVETTADDYAIMQYKTSTSDLWQSFVSPDNDYRIGISTVGDAITIDSSFNVGIGTSSPSAKLHLYTAGLADGILIEGNDNNNVKLRLKNIGTGGEEWQIQAGQQGASNSGFHIRSNTASANRLSIDSSGTLITHHNIREQIYNLTGTEINPVNGSVQYKTLAANTTFTESLSDGDSVILRISGGNTYTVTWPTMTWVTSAGNAAPTLGGSDVVVLWQESSTVYGAYVGSYA